MQLSLTALSLIVVGLVLLSAFFAAAEIGVMSLNRYRLRHLVKKGHKNAERVNTLLMHPDRVLGVVLIGNTMGNIIASMAATLIGQRLYGDTGVWVATLLLTLVILIFSEMTPKTLAALYPQPVAFACAWGLMMLDKILSPIVKLMTSIARQLLRLLGISMTRTQKEALSGEELRTVVHEAGSLLPTEHQSMLLSLLDLEQACVEDIMIPKSEIVGIDLEQSWAHVLEQLQLTQHTRLPLYRHTIDHLVGMIHLRKVLHAALEETLTLERLLALAEDPYYIPEATSLNIQILNFQKMKHRSGFVVNEYGDLQGLVTMEDILEEVVGEFTTDIAALSKDITPLTEQTFMIDGGVTLRQLNRVLNWQLPLMGPKTLSGLIIETLGFIPPAECCLKILNYHIEILKVSDNRVKTVRMKQESVARV